jgi:hypothetical protein
MKTTQSNIAPGRPGGGGRKLGCMGQLVLLIVMLAVIGFGIPALFTPWGFFMGGRFHVFPMWQGWGKMHSNTAGGDYVIRLYFYPKTGRTLGTTHEKGNAVLCTPRGEKFNLSLGGDFQKDLRTDTNGKTASFYMSNQSTKSKFTGQDRPHLELRGKWANPDLVLDDHGSIARNFEPDATLYNGHSPSRPYMREVVPVTLHEGGNSEFEAACKALKGER